MWDCGQCGCQAIAPGLPFCPQCFRERDMPKTTAAGGSNAWDEPATADADVPAAESDAAEPVPADAVAAGEAAVVASVAAEPAVAVPEPDAPAEPVSGKAKAGKNES